jgi:hypothetical protein
MHICMTEAEQAFARVRVGDVLGGAAPVQVGTEAVSSVYACMHSCMHACKYACMYACMQDEAEGAHRRRLQSPLICMHACMHAPYTLHVRHETRHTRSARPSRPAALARLSRPSVDGLGNSKLRHTCISAFAPATRPRRHSARDSSTSAHNSVGRPILPTGFAQH